MTGDPQAHMLLELDKLVENGPLHVRTNQIASIGAQAGLDEKQSFRVFRRLLREGRVVGDLIIVDEDPGFAGAWIEDVLLR